MEELINKLMEPGAPSGWQPLLRSIRKLEQQTKPLDDWDVDQLEYWCDQLPKMPAHESTWLWEARFFGAIIGLSLLAGFVWGPRMAVAVFFGCLLVCGIAATEEDYEFGERVTDPKWLELASRLKVYATLLRLKARIKENEQHRASLDARCERIMANFQA